MYEIAVPSFKRSETFVRKTLKVIRETKLPEEKVTVFVADASELEDYKRTTGEAEFKGKLQIAEKGMRAVRNFIQQFYPEGEKVLNLDDDIEGMYERVSAKELRPLDNFHAVAKEAFGTAKAVGLRLWGVYPVCNPYFMKDKMTTDLKYIEGAVWGVINSRDKSLAVTLDDKEDFERSILFYIADGGVLRYSHISFRTKFYKEAGGMQIDRTTARITESAMELLRRYPALTSLNNSKKSEYTEIRLRDARPKKAV